VTFDVTFETTSKTGTFTLRHRMTREGSLWFSQIDKREMVVAQPQRRR
jgi:hypothetical protein